MAIAPISSSQKTHIDGGILLLQTGTSARFPGEAWGKISQDLVQAKAGIYILYQKIGSLTSFWRSYGGL